MADIFDEIDEELKRDRAQVLWAKYGKYVISAAAAVVLVVGASQGYNAWNKRQVEMAAETYQAALNADDVGGALEAGLSSLTGGYAMLAKFRLAAELAEAGDVVAAEQAYLALSTESGLDPLYQQAAVMLSVMVAVDTGDIADLQNRLSGLTSAAGAWQALALEVSAGLDLRAGNRASAKTKIDQVLALPEVPNDLRQRAQRMALVLED